jgi:hypothetical protein
MSVALLSAARREGAVPLAWAGGTAAQDYLNFGDALSPVMTALLSGLPAQRTPFRSRTPRLAAVGTIGQNLVGGEVWFWGVGCSPRAGAKGGRFSPDPGTKMHVAATRGPLSAALLGGGRLATRVYGDPVWLLPRFYRPQVEKRWDLGVILHLSELADRAVECHPRSDLARFRIEDPAAERVRLINTVTPISTEGLRNRLDDILACRRIVSTSLHGLVIAESYGIPCLYFPPGVSEGSATIPLRADAGLDARMVDLYAGIGRREISLYEQAPDRLTDWNAVIAAVDRSWRPAQIDEEALIAAFPLDLAPLTAPTGGTIFDHPVLNAFPYAHDVAALTDSDDAASRETARASAAAAAAAGLDLQAWRIPAVATPSPPSPPLLIEREAEGVATFPLSWAAGPKGAARVNLGDSFSAMLVAAMTGLPVRHRAFVSDRPRLAAVGTIGHGFRGGDAHFWGTGFDAGLDPTTGRARWSAPADTRIAVHALRGPRSAELLRLNGIDTPEIFGDPGIFVNRLFPMDRVRKTHDLGVVLHMSELRDGLRPRPPARSRPWWMAFSRPTVDAVASGGPDADAEGSINRPEHRRYELPSGEGRVRLIEMYVEPTLDAVAAKLAEIASCRTILSTSLHGLVFAEAYGVPCAWFGFGEGGVQDVDLLDDAAQIDHRVLDLYTGRGLRRLTVCHAPREQPSDWSRLIRDLRGLSAPVLDAEALFDAFPGPRAVRFADPVWPLRAAQVPGFS